MRPLIFLFAGEHEGAKFRHFMTTEAIKKESVGKARKVILDTIEYYRTLHPEALETINGIRMERPSWKIKDEDEQRLAYNLKKLQLKEESEKTDVKDPIEVVTKE